MMDDLPREEVVAILDELIAELLTKADIHEPPVDAIVLAQRHLGMSVLLDRRQTERGRAQRAGKRPQIFLRPEPTVERHQWSVAHEIGEHLKTQILARLNLEPEEARILTGDSLTNVFSSRLLVPGFWFADDARRLDCDLLQLKQRYSTASHEVIARRFLELPFPTVITVVDNDTVELRKSNGPRVSKTLEPIEREAQQYVNLHSKPKLLARDSWTVQCWPIHQTDWRREILRSVVEEQ